MTIQSSGASSTSGQQVLRLAGEEGHHPAPLEKAPRRALPHEVGEVGAEGGVEDRIRVGRQQGLHRGAGVDPAEGRELLRHELRVRARAEQQLLEPAHGRLAVLVVGRHRGPALRRELRRLLHQHRRLHVGAGREAGRCSGCRATRRAHPSSGSLATKSRRFWLAKSARARPTLEKKPPASSATRSALSSSSAIRTASSGRPASSRKMVSIGRPLTPPAALTCSCVMSQALR